MRLTPAGWSGPLLGLSLVVMFALALGVWDAAVDPAGERWVLRLVLPLLLVVFVAALYSRAKRERIRADEARRASEPEDQP